MEELLLADGFDAALIGTGERCGQPIVAVYDREKCIDILMTRDGMSVDEAAEYFEYNVQGAYVGEETPVFMNYKENILND